VVAAVLAALGETREEIMLISTGGVLIRTRVNDIRVMGRSTQGVTLINLDEGTYLAGLEKVVETEEMDGEVAEDAENTGAVADGAADGNGNSNGSNDEINDPDQPEAED
jgi:DNA gyrase subunit A